MRISLLRMVPLVAMAACSPLGPVPGGELKGEPAATAPADWSFADAHKTIQLEVRPADPYSVNLWCVVADGQLYVGAGQGASSAWARALLGDGRARVRIDTTLYEVVATRVTAEDEIQTYLEALSRKYERSRADPTDFQSDEGQLASAILFRLDPARRNGAP